MDGEYRENDIKIRYVETVQEKGIENDNIKFMKLKPSETTKNLVLKNIPIDIIAKCTGLSIEEISKLTTNYTFLL